MLLSLLDIYGSRYELLPQVKSSIEAQPAPADTAAQPPPADA
jgi:hypothetical protein